MKFNNSEAQIFVPNGLEAEAALARTTALCVAAHQDDIEIMAYGPIAECFGKTDAWFTGIVATDGAGSPRSGVYERFTDEEMKTVRAAEQNTAASIGRYAAVVQLAYPSGEVKDPVNAAPVDELARLIRLCGPQTVYTHNLADKHDTHVAVALRVIAALRRLDVEQRPQRLVALEVWRGLDWLCDAEKIVCDTSGHQNLAASLLGVYDSQIAGGKRYDLAALGRRAANATFFASHFVDECDSMIYGLDMTPLMNDAALSPEDFINGAIARFKDEVNERIKRFRT
ncbi:MAG TPA: PIG-L family deacetylase [Clostridiales bacterium]|nr:MAG: GlcNAc-PI de-N-acetylase [Firmicutes bacterium ADurb.Bin262]HOU09472.1 PIG-L family deacetylase [Clostridiales bacterium]HQH63492.1 PIG-L family deacetylase [Clostridiales bacterium]HQK72962.1 PIG-L family deacetylase [Clostridiales bacterium]